MMGKSTPGGKPRCSPADLWPVVPLWLALTVAFECLSFHLAAGKPWEVLPADGDVPRGRICVPVPLGELLAPPELGWRMRAILDRRASEESGS
jgi:hypothetical protein